MKVCPKCQKTYDDDSLNFCLEDGTVLTLETVAYNETPETVIVNPPIQTTPNSPFGVNTDWQNTPTNDVSVKSGSKTWLWAIGILLVGLLLCGGSSLVGLFILGSMDEEAKQRENDQTISENQDTSKTKDDSRNLDKKVNFDEISFKNSEYITVENTKYELELTCVNKYFYVIAFDSTDSKDATITLDVKNSSGKMTNSGYGLVFHSDPDKALKRDYAFVIDSNAGKYRFVSHRNTKEKEITHWTSSKAIRKGTRKNKLEARISDEKVKLYINDKFIKTIKIKTSYDYNVAGVYTSDNVPITFSNMEIRK